MSVPNLLDGNEVVELERMIEEATRSTSEGVRRFIEPANGTLRRATSKQHHLVFGRRGSGKSSLLRKAAEDLNDCRPIAFVDLESFKGHAYPDLIISILLKALHGFKVWLKLNAGPASASDFLKTLFSTTPRQSLLAKKHTKALMRAISEQTKELESRLHSANEAEVVQTSQVSTESGSSSESHLKMGLPDGVSKIGFSGTGSAKSSTSNQQRNRFRLSKADYLNRNILKFQEIFREMAALSGGDSYLFLDDLYHIRRTDQAGVVDYFHRIAKGNGLWLKVGTIRHRSTWYVHGDPPSGMKIGDDAEEIDLDLTLENYSSTRGFLARILDTFMNEASLSRRSIMTDGALDRLVLASGGVARDFLGILRRSISFARTRGGTTGGDRLGVEDVNAAAGEYYSSKREELLRDTAEEGPVLENAFWRITQFCRRHSKTNVFLLDKDLPESAVQQIAELVDLRLIHKVRGRVTVPNRASKIYEAYMIDVSQYTASRRMRNFRMVDFWRDGASNQFRQAGLIYMEVVNGRVTEQGQPLSGGRDGVPGS